MQRSRLDERTLEFERLRQVQLQDAEENNALKSRLQELKSTNEKEKHQLEAQMKHVIHSQVADSCGRGAALENWLLQLCLVYQWLRSHCTTVTLLYKYTSRPHL